MISSNFLENIENKSQKKLRGGYYTPNQIANYVANWAIVDGTETVLEPSCGDGAFLDAIINTFTNLGFESDIYRKIHAVELHKNEAAKINENILEKINIHIGDFFQYCQDQLIDKIQFDCIVGNPPFIRYQDFPEVQRTPAFALMKRAGLNPTKLTNTWIPFLVTSTLLLKEKGRLGMVIPAELFQVNYAAETRKFLSEKFYKLQILTFKKLVFSKIQQEVVVLLGEKRTTRRNFINIFELDNIDDLKSFKLPTQNHKIELDHSNEKWTQYYLTKYEIDLLRSLKNNPKLPVSGEYIDVDVGIVTGQNKFFVLSQKEIAYYKLNDFTSRIVGKANQLKGVLINNNDWEELLINQYPNFLINLPAIKYDELPENLQKYVKIGEAQKYHLGYKCRIRKHWWSVPSIWTPDAFMLRQVHSFPKLVLNQCDATNTDTLHRIRFINGANGNEIVSAFINSLTFAFSEVTGRSYGGGVLTFEPSEAENLPLPVNQAHRLDFQKIDHLVRENKISKVLDINDQILLRDGLGISESDIKTLNNIWQKLRDRRIYRNRR